MLTRTLLFVALFLPCIADHASAQDDAKAPCTTLAAYLRDYATTHPDKAADSGGSEFLSAAIGLWNESSDPQVPIGSIPTKTPDTMEHALDMIPGAAIDPADSSFLADQGLTSEWTTYVRDLRPYSPYVMVSQMQGTMHCDVTATFRVEEKRLVPVPAAETSEGDVCWTESLTALRIGPSAYPAIAGEDEGPDSLAYAISLLRPESAIATDVGFCRVTVTYVPKLFIAGWNVALGSDSAFIARLRAVLDPIMTSGADESEAALKALEPKPSDNTAYDVYLRADEDKRYDVLDVLDTDGPLGEIPFTDQSYTDAHDMPAYPIGFEHRRFILRFGQPTLGWRTFPSNAFALWEWKDRKLVPLASGYVEKRADKPVIAVE
jgi:hypothetical protein